MSVSALTISTVPVSGENHGGNDQPVPRNDCSCVIAVLVFVDGLGHICFEGILPSDQDVGRPCNNDSSMCGKVSDSSGGSAAYQDCSGAFGDYIRRACTGAKVSNDSGRKPADKHIGYRGAGNRASTVSRYRARMEVGYAGCRGHDFCKLIDLYQSPGYFGNSRSSQLGRGAAKRHRPLSRCGNLCAAN